MQHQIIGTIVEAKRQLWFKVNTKPVRTDSFDGAIFPYIVKIKYIVDGTDYFKRHWVQASITPPSIGSTVKLIYDDRKPSKAKICK